MTDLTHVERAIYAAYDTLNQDSDPTPPHGIERPPFVAFPKIPRLFRDCVITEKIDGTNAQVHITEDGDVGIGSRNRWISPVADNFGFARYVHDNIDTFLQLGPGTHFGEWWGKGIQRGYGLSEKRFSLFNTGRWNEANVPEGLHVVPVLYSGSFSSDVVGWSLDMLRYEGSVAAAKFMDAEGVMVYHSAANTYFKVTLKNDESPKGAQK